MSFWGRQISACLPTRRRQLLSPPSRAAIRHRGRGPSRQCVTDLVEELELPFVVEHHDVRTTKELRVFFAGIRRDYPQKPPPLQSAPHRRLATLTRCAASLVLQGGEG